MDPLIHLRSPCPALRLRLRLRLRQCPRHRPSLQGWEEAKDQHSKVQRQAPRKKLDTLCATEQPH